MSKKNVLITDLVFNSIILVMEAVALVLSAFEYGVGLFGYYTQCSNILLGISCAVSVFFAAKALKGGEAEEKKWSRLLKFIGTSSVALTLVVVLTVLIPSRGHGRYTAESVVHYLLTGSNLFMHFVCPVAAILVFVFLEHKARISFRETLFAMIPAFIYACISTSLNATNLMYGPYPFLHVHEQSVLASAFWFIAIVLLSYVLALAVWGLNKIGKENK